IATIGTQLKPLLAGTVKSIKFAGNVFDRTALDLTERYLKYIFVHTDASASPSSSSTMHAALFRAADAGFAQYLPGYQSYQNLKKWADDTGKRIDGAWEALKK